MLHVKYFMSKRCYISSYQIWANTGCGKPDWTSSDLASTPEKYQKSEYPQYLHHDKNISDFDNIKALCFDHYL